MTLYDYLETDLILDEGERLRPYRCTAGKLTIGIGRNIEDRGISIEESRYLFKNDIDECAADLGMNFRWYAPLDDVRKAVLLNLRFNIGPHRFRGFKRMLSAIEAGDFNTAANELKDSAWYTQVQPSRSKRMVEQLRTGKR